MNPAHPSLDGMDKAAIGTVDEPNKLQGYASAPDIVDETTRVVDHKAERRLCRRFDMRILPILAVMCMSALNPLAVISDLISRPLRGPG
jgi:hypothetical protein